MGIQATTPNGVNAFEEEDELSYVSLGDRNASGFAD